MYLCLLSAVVFSFLFFFFCIQSLTFFFIFINIQQLLYSCQVRSEPDALNVLFSLCNAMIYQLFCFGGFFLPRNNFVSWWISNQCSLILKIQMKPWTTSDQRSPCLLPGHSTLMTQFKHCLISDSFVQI